MSAEPRGEIADMLEELALPRSNGELVFAAPWEGRAFGMAVALNEGGMYAWAEFQRRLVDEIAAADDTDDGGLYYERWLAGLEALLLDYGVFTHAELDARTAAYQSRELEDV